MTLNKKENNENKELIVRGMKENKELIIREIKEEFSELFDLKFDEVEFTDKFMKKFEEVFKESFYTKEEGFDLDSLEKEIDIFRIYYKYVMDCVEYMAKFCNEHFNKKRVYTYEPPLTCTFLKEKGEYQYTVNEYAVMQKSFEFYIEQIYEHYKLMEKYLEVHQL